MTANHRTFLRYEGAAWLLLTLACAVGGADEWPGGQRQILAELESRWWGWSSAPSPIVPSPKSCELSGESWTLTREQGVTILTSAQALPQETYIATTLQHELTGRHHLSCRMVSDPAEVGTPALVVCLGTPGRNTLVARLCSSRGIDAKWFERPESYVLDCFADEQDGRRWILIAGGDPVGCIHGGYSLMQLLRGTTQGVKILRCKVRDYPSVAVRSLRGIGEGVGMKLQLHTTSRYLKRNVTGDEIHSDELLLPCLDWLARNRINCFHLLSECATTLGCRPG